MSTIIQHITPDATSDIVGILNLLLNNKAPKALPVSWTTNFPLLHEGITIKARCHTAYRAS
jgi:hypothetical protein